MVSVLEEYIPKANKENQGDLNNIIEILKNKNENITQQKWYINIFNETALISNKFKNDIGKSAKTKRNK